LARLTSAPGTRVEGIRFPTRRVDGGREILRVVRTATRADLDRVGPLLENPSAFSFPETGQTFVSSPRPPRPSGPGRT